MIKNRLWRISAMTLILMTAFASLFGTGAARQQATTSSASCETYATPTGTMGTPMPAMDHAHGMGTPAASVEFDQSYIDMMIPHHASIIALAQAALPRLTDDRLIALAESIISAQEAEIEELRGHRAHFYGSPDPMPVDDAAMTQMMGDMAMSMEEMMVMMDAEALVATFCASANPDLAFIDLTIPHHQSAISASEVALQQATHEEIRNIAERVISDQQREIDELNAIREDLSASGSVSGRIN